MDLDKDKAAPTRDKPLIILLVKGLQIVML
jgi:hypothetical protein